MPYKEAVRNHLEQQVESQRFASRFDQIKGRHRALSEFSSVGELRTRLCDHSTSYVITDGVLLALIQEYQQQRDSDALALLHLLVFPSLDHIFNSKRSAEADIDLLWGEVEWAFLQAVLDYPVNRRRGRVAANLQLDTLLRVCRWQRAEVRAQEASARLAQYLDTWQEDLALLGAGVLALVGTPPKAAIKPTFARAEARRAKGFLMRLVDQGIITEIDLRLLVEVHLQGRKVRHIADDLGLTYETARKRKQRAEAAIRKHCANKN